MAVRGAYARYGSGTSTTRREPLRSRSVERGGDGDDGDGGGGGGGGGRGGGGSRAAGGERRTSTTVSHARSGANDAISKPHRSTADMWAEVGQMDATGTRPERVQRQNRGQRGRGARPGSEGVSGAIDPAMLHILAHTSSVGGISSSGGSAVSGGLTGVSSSGSILSSTSRSSSNAAASHGRGRGRGRSRVGDSGGSSSFSSSHRSGSSTSSSVSWGSSISSSDYSTSSSASSRSSSSASSRSSRSSGSSVSSGSTSSSRGRSYARSNSSASSTRGSSLGFGGPLPSPVLEGSEGSGSSASSGGTGGFGDDDGAPRTSRSRGSRGFVKPVRVRKVAGKAKGPGAGAGAGAGTGTSSAVEGSSEEAGEGGGVEEPISPHSRIFRSLAESMKRATEGGEAAGAAAGDREAKLRRAAEALKNAGVNADGGAGGFINDRGGGGGFDPRRRVLPLERQDTGRQWPAGPKHFSQGSSIFDSVASGELDQLEEREEQRRRQRQEQQHEQRRQQEQQQRQEQQQQQQQPRQADEKETDLEDVASLGEGSSFSAELFSLGTTDAGSSPRSSAGGGSDWAPSDASLLDSLGTRRSPGAASVAGDHGPSAHTAIAALEEEDSVGDVNEDNKVGSGDLAGGGTGRSRRRHRRIGSSGDRFSYDTQDSGSTTPANDSSSSTASARGDNGSSSSNSWTWQQKSFGTVSDVVSGPV